MRELIIQVFLSFCDAACPKYEDKAKFLKQCHPIIAVNVLGDSKDYCMVTNFKIVDG
jgi:hypothetical protein